MPVGLKRHRRNLGATLIQLGGAWGAAPTGYPTVANSLLWIDPTNSYTDDGATLAIATQAVKTILLGTNGWGSTLGTGKVTQGTVGKRPTLQANNLLTGDGSTTSMSLPTAISLSGDTTLYFAASLADYRQIIIPIAGENNGDYGNNFSLNGGVARVISAALGVSFCDTHLPGLSMVRIQRRSGEWYYKGPEGPELDMGNMAGGLVLVDGIMARDAIAAGSPIYNDAGIGQGSVALIGGIPSGSEETAIRAKFASTHTGITLF